MSAEYIYISLCCPYPKMYELAQYWLQRILLLRIDAVDEDHVNTVFLVFLTQELTDPRYEPMPPIVRSQPKAGKYKTV